MSAPSIAYPAADGLQADIQAAAVVPGATPVTARGRLLGELLLKAGKLKPDHIERILRAQREQHLRFGETAIRLRLVTQEDVEQALSRQFGYPYLHQGDARLGDELVAAYQPFGAPAEAIRGLRSQLMLRWFDLAAGRQALAVVSTGRGEGRSFMAANLAVGFSQLGQRTLLIDADMRNPRQHRLFKLDNDTGLSAVLSGRGGLDCARRVPVFADLQVLAAGPQPPNPQELLARPLFQDLLSAAAGDFDIVVIDTAAGEDTADAQTVAARAGGALMVVRRHNTKYRQAHHFTRNLVESGVIIVGSVINSF